DAELSGSGLAIIQSNPARPVDEIPEEPPSPLALQFHLDHLEAHSLQHPMAQIRYFRQNFALFHDRRPPRKSMSTHWTGSLGVQNKKVGDLQPTSLPVSQRYPILEGLTKSSARQFEKKS